MIFTETELKSLEDFETKHLKCYNKKDALSSVLGFTINRSWGSGIGINTTITCNCCGKTEDVSDYKAW